MFPMVSARRVVVPDALCGSHRFAWAKGSTLCTLRGWLACWVRFEASNKR